jgi:hypothetical protein
MRWRLMADQQRCRSGRHGRDDSCLHNLVQRRSMRIAKAPPGGQEEHALNCPPPFRTARFEMRANRGQACSERTAYTAHAQAKLVRNLSVGQPSDVGELDHLLVLWRQPVQSFVDRLPGHRAGEVNGAGRPADQDLFEVRVCASCAPSVDGYAAGPGRQPGAPEPLLGGLPVGVLRFAKRPEPSSAHRP